MDGEDKGKTKQRKDGGREGGNENQRNGGRKIGRWKEGGIHGGRA